MIPGSILCVVGNGSGDCPPSGVSLPCVTFNQVAPTSWSDDEIRVVNRKVAGRTNTSEPFRVTGSRRSPAWCGALQGALSETAEELEAALECLPSTGFATTWALVQMGFALHLYRMPLRPSLRRPTGLSERTPLPAAFHNWLGERRLAWQYLYESTAILSWPQLPLSDGEAGERSEPTMEDPVRTLAQWFESQTGEPDQRDFAGLVELARQPAGAWLQPADAVVLKSLEQFFFLKRDNHETPNWWLYSNELSPFIDTLLLRLMQVQQQPHLSPETS